MTKEYAPDVKADLPAGLLHDTLVFSYWVFVVYVVWDVLGGMMALARIPQPGGAPAKPRYPEVDEKKTMTDRPSKPDLAGLSISFIALICLFVLLLSQNLLGKHCAYFGLVTVLVGYRFLKEHRTLLGKT
jgi:hypothetical protein